MFRHLGPLTRSGAAELAMSLPALRELGESERELAWRLTAGHPRAMEYLDALLAAWRSASTHLAGRVAAAVQARTGQSAGQDRTDRAVRGGRARSPRRPRVTSCSASCSTG